MDYRQSKTMHQSPDQKTQMGTMPESPKSHGNEKIEITISLFAPAERNIQVVTQPQG